MNSNLSKPIAGAALPQITVQSTQGHTINIGQPSENWTLFVVYRGKHCGRCKRYLSQLESMKTQWESAGFDIVTTSADTLDKASTDITEFGWTFPVTYGLTETDMQRLGLYISDPLTPDETDKRFAEPAVFCLRPDATIQIAAISNGPSARPDLVELLDGMIFTMEHDKPARGTV